jgi:AcrR family transcriptional regulator
MSISGVSRDAQREQTRRRLYEAALAIFRRDGVVACRIDDIAKAAGVSRGTFYFHFPTKEDVLLERMRETEVQICAALDAYPSDAPLTEVVGTLAQKLAEIWEHDPQLLPEVTSAALRYTAATMHDQEATPLRSTLAARFTAAAARGEIASSLAPAILGDIYLGNTLAGLLAWYANPSIPLRGVLDAMTLVFWNGVRKEGSDGTDASRG